MFLQIDRGVARIFGQGGPAKTQVGPTNFPRHNILNLLPPLTTFLVKKFSGQKHYSCFRSTFPHFRITFSDASPRRFRQH